MNEFSAEKIENIEEEKKETEFHEEELKKLESWKYAVNGWKA